MNLIMVLLRAVFDLALVILGITYLLQNTNHWLVAYPLVLTYTLLVVFTEILYKEDIDRVDEEDL